MSQIFHVLGCTPVSRLLRRPVSAARWPVQTDVWLFIGVTFSLDPSYSEKAGKCNSNLKPRAPSTGAATKNKKCRHNEQYTDAPICRQVSNRFATCERTSRRGDVRVRRFAKLVAAVGIGRLDGRDRSEQRVLPRGSSGGHGTVFPTQDQDVGGH